MPYVARLVRAVLDSDLETRELVPSALLRGATTARLFVAPDRERPASDPDLHPIKPTDRRVSILLTLCSSKRSYYIVREQLPGPSEMSDSGVCARQPGPDTQGVCNQRGQYCTCIASTCRIPSSMLLLTL